MTLLRGQASSKMTSTGGKSIVFGFHRLAPWLCLLFGQVAHQCCQLGPRVCHFGPLSLPLQLHHFLFISRITNLTPYKLWASQQYRLATLPKVNKAKEQTYTHWLKYNDNYSQKYLSLILRIRQKSINQMILYNF